MQYFLTGQDWIGIARAFGACSEAIAWVEGELAAGVEAPALVDALRRDRQPWYSWLAARTTFEGATIGVGAFVGAGAPIGATAG